MKYDVIVVGGGPAGSIASKECARMDLDVLLLEKRNFPRYKPCGGAISKKAFSYLKDDVCERHIYGTKAFFSFKDKIEVKLREPLAITTCREKLDDFLLKDARKEGVNIEEGEMVLDVRIEKEGVLVETKDKSFRGDVLVGADGVYGVVARKMGMGNKYKTDSFGICLVCEAKIGEKNIERMMDPQMNELYYFGIKGYGWVFPKRESISVGIGGYSSSMRNPKGIFDAFIKSLKRMKGQDFETGKIYTHLIPAGGLERDVGKERILLCGDAAGFVDPFSGEGIYYALHSGALASLSVKEAFESKDWGFLDYGEKCRKEFLQELVWARRFVRLAYCNPSLFFLLLERDPSILKKYVEVTEGKLPYADFFLWYLKRLPLSFAKVIYQVIK
jgi:geranylgeranyl reductase family protein